MLLKEQYQSLLTATGKSTPIEKKPKRFRGKPKLENLFVSLKKSCTKMKNDRCFICTSATCLTWVPIQIQATQDLGTQRYPALQTCASVSHLEEDVSLTKLNSQKILTKKRLPQTSYTKSERNWRELQNFLIFSLGILNNNGFQREAWKKNAAPYCGKMSASVAFAVAAEVDYFISKEWNET